MHTTNYTNTFIAVADDCPVSVGEVPTKKAGEHTIASLQYELIANNPYTYSSDDIVFQIFAERNDLTKSSYPTERKKFFSKGQACLRSSPLTKRYGWGVHHDAQGKVAIYARDSADYRRLLGDKSIAQVKGMRSKRPR